MEELEKGPLFKVQDAPPESPATKRKASRAVAVVDPFSTGAVLAYELSRRGYIVYAGDSYHIYNEFRIQYFFSL